MKAAARNLSRNVPVWGRYTFSSLDWSRVPGLILLSSDLQYKRDVVDTMSSGADYENNTTPNRNATSVKPYLLHLTLSQQVL